MATHPKIDPVSVPASCNCQRPNGSPPLLSAGIPSLNDVLYALEHCQLPRVSEPQPLALSDRALLERAETGANNTLKSLTFGVQTVGQLMVGCGKSNSSWLDDATLQNTGWLVEFLGDLIETIEDRRSDIQYHLRENQS